MKDEGQEIDGMHVTKNVAQQLIVSLYLRLNGYFYSGHIVHAPRSTAGEVDVLAVRFPYYRELNFKPCPALNVSDQYMDIAICEIKGGKRFPRFNAALERSETIESILQRVGLIDDDAVTAGMAKDVAAMVEGYDSNRRNVHPDQLVYKHLGVRLRTIMFRPDQSDRVSNQPYYICGSDLTAHLINRLRETPDDQIAGDSRCQPCDKNYRLNQWGMYERMVCLAKKSDGPVGIPDLYRALGVRETMHGACVS